MEPKSLPPGPGEVTGLLLAAAYLGLRSRDALDPQAAGELEAVAAKVAAATAN